MAKSKKPEDNQELTFMGHSVDSEIQKKVEQYMEVDESAVPETAEESAPVIASDGLVSTAPLLPTDELPAMVKNDTSAPQKIAIKHFEETEAELKVDDETTVETEVAVSEAEEVEPEKSVVETDEAPLDSELIDLNSDPDVIAAPGFEDDDIDKTKTIGELAGSLPLDDNQLGQVIEEIVAEDADKLLEVEDEKTKDEATTVEVKPKKERKKRGNFFKAWLGNTLYRNITIGLIMLGIVASLAIPTSRYFVLNTAGVRASVSIKVLDDKTSLSLKNVEFVVDGKSTKSDGNGDAKLDKVKLGKLKVIIKKSAFAELKKTVTLGWGSNPLGEQRLVPTGTQFTFTAKDFTSNKPVADTEVNFGDSSAKFNPEGEAVLTIPAVEDDQIEVTVSAKNYRDEKVKISTTTKDKTNVSMVPAKKHVFVSKRSGKLDLYKTDVDGKNQAVILAATGIEREESLSLSSHPTKPVVAFASTRENNRNQDGFLLTTLNLIYLDTNEVVKVAQSERIQIVDWSGDYLVYVKITQGASEANPNRHKIMSYNIEQQTEKELASTNYFNDVVSVNGVIYYSPAVYKVNGKVGLYRVNADGTNKKTIYDKEVWNLFRTTYDKFSLSVGQDWYELNLPNDEVKKVGGAPSVLKSRVYVDSPNHKQSIWVDVRDGKSVLLNYSVDKKSDQALVNESGIKNPIYWLDDDHVVYRVADGDETADYVLSLSGGEPKKIGDVTNTIGIDRWYYF